MSPRAARASMKGLLMRVLPAYPRASTRVVSIVIRMMSRAGVCERRLRHSSTDAADRTTTVASRMNIRMRDCGVGSVGAEDELRGFIEFSFGGQQHDQ